MINILNFKHHPFKNNHLQSFLEIEYWKLFVIWILLFGISIN